MTGNTGNPFIYEWAGNPTNANIKALNPPQGALVIDTTTGNWYRKTSAGNNSGYALVSDSSTAIIDPTTGYGYQITISGGQIAATRVS